MVQFPIQALMSFEKCYKFLLGILHPLGLHCPDGHPLVERQKPHKFRKNGLPCYRCQACGKVFNIFTGTILKGIHYDCINIVLMLRGFAKGDTTQMLSKELKVSYNALLDWRHLLQEFAFENRDVSCLTDTDVESDEVFQNAGEKGVPHTEAGDPPRVRANKKKASALLKTTARPSKGSSAGKASRSV
jgi:transposase-like protein